jgi:hypothetical protein
MPGNSTKVEYRYAKSLKYRCLAVRGPQFANTSVECLLRFGSGNPARSCQTEACTLEMDADPGITNDNM